MTRRVVVLPHDPRWSEEFRREAGRLRAILGDLVVGVEHIGSTAIRGASAKPIVDVLLIVRHIEAMDAHNARMRAEGYVPRGEQGIPGRRFFVRGTLELRTHHVHAYQCDSPEIHRHLAFRDYMNAHPDEVSAYSRLKEELALRYPEDARAYSAGKERFVREAEARAIAWWAGLAARDAAAGGCPVEPSRGTMHGEHEGGKGPPR